ncbi:DUF4919 domain-containing protein [Alistipes ihumii]|uniref:DUF4919 domain-containing protein n=1 Tax=Alistipes ihumii TaxID=1470347 RepID=UPI002657C7B7|nr:DUF4919 domain-containing protein [Alistipes ihumii]
MIPIRRICSICLFAWLAVPLAAEAAGLGRHPSGKKTDRAQYARLCERFESGDTTLAPDQCGTVYYGFAAQSRYNGSLGYGEVDAMTLIEQDKPQEAFALCERILNKAPVSLQGHMMMLLAASRAAIPPEQACRYAIRFDGLLDAVFRSGDGRSVRTAFRVLSVADEYVVMQALGVESVLSQSLVEEHYDRIEISGATGYEGDEIYFDVSLPMKHLDKVFGKNSRTVRHTA